MGGLEVRELRYFEAVAEELHFGRAAQRLGMAQPPLSRAIKQLERRLGVTLLERSSHRVALTPAGEVLLREARVVLAQVAAAQRRTRRAAAAEPRLILAMKAGGDGGLLPGLLDAFRRSCPGVGVDVELCGRGEQAVMLREGRADVALVHGPRDDLTGFDTADLLVERQVVVLPGDHRLARRAHVGMAEVLAEPVPVWPLAPEGPSLARGVDNGRLAQLISWGRAAALLPESVRSQLPRGLVCVPVPDAPPTTLKLAWPAGARSPVLAAFVRAAVAAADSAVAVTDSAVAVTDPAVAVTDPAVAATDPAAVAVGPADATDAGESAPGARVPSS